MKEKKGGKGGGVDYRVGGTTALLAKGFPSNEKPLWEGGNRPDVGDHGPHGVAGRSLRTFLLNRNASNKGPFGFSKLKNKRTSSRAGRNLKLKKGKSLQDEKNHIDAAKGGKQPAHRSLVLGKGLYY